MIRQNLLNSLLCSIILIAPAFTVMAQTYKPGPQDLVFFSGVDETNQPYSIYIPGNYDHERAYPLVVFLHGAMSNNRLGLRRVFGQGNIQGVDFITPGNVPAETDLEATRYFPELHPVDYIVAAPLARGTAGYQGIPEQDVYDMIDDIKSRFRIDEDRVYLTGLSMGGGGTMWLGLTRPDIWAAIAPVCPATPAGALELAPNALNLPVHLFVGDQDFIYQNSLDWKRDLENNGVNLQYVEYPGIGHNSWEMAYEDAYIFDWFGQFKRDLFPERVVFTTRQYKYNKAYWVTVDRLTPGTMSKVEAAFTAPNAIDVTTSGTGAFSVHLEGHPQFDPGSRLTVTVDGRTFRLPTPGVASFTLEDDRWVNRRYTPGLTSKRKGAEGPVIEAMAGNHIYVYGTADDPTQDELAARREQAANAANWSVERGAWGRVMIFPRVLADRDVRQSDLEYSNLVLFGTRETNTLIDKYAGRLPMHLDPGDDEHGLVYIFPVNGRYVVVNSGLPWWTPTASGRPIGPGGGLAALPPQNANLFGIEDFLLFHKTPDNIISKGRFDHEWQLAPLNIEKLSNSGVINLNSNQ